jgi:hypothetical protein
MAFATVPLADWAVGQGADEIRSVKSSSLGHREFCGRCGTPLLMKVDHQPDTVDFSIATLDEPAAIELGFHIFWASRVRWFPGSAGLPTHDRFRPGTRGLPTGNDPSCD